MPKVNTLNFKGNLLLGSGDLIDLIAFLIENSVNIALACLKFGGINLYLNTCVLTVYGRSDLYAGSGVIIKIEVRLCYRNKVYVTVKTAVEGEIRHLRIYGLVGRIIYDDRKCVVACLEAVSKVYSPSRVTAVVMIKLLAVKIKVCGRICAADLKVVKSLAERFLVDGLSVKARTSEVIVTAVKAVLGVPRMRQSYRYGTFGSRRICAILNKLPTVIYLLYFSHKRLLKFI